eukprot:6171649-Alexandrium_andersonii.AAC.1
MTVLSYNVLSMRKAGRWIDMAQELSEEGVVCLQGTRTPMRDHPVTYRMCEGFHVLESGYGKKGNKHAGVA